LPVDIVGLHVVVFNRNMIETTQFKTPGQLIQALLDDRGWTQRVLAVVLKADETGINKILAGKRPLDADLALALSGIFGVPAEKFLELQKTYELAQARIQLRDDPGMATRAQLFGSLPVADMVKRGWLRVDDIRDFPKVESALAKFFGAQSVNQIEKVFPHAAKKTNVSDDITPIQLAWFYRVKEISSEMLTARFSPDAVRDAISKLKPLLKDKDSVRKVPRILQDCGIRYVIVEALPSAKIDGVCFWLDENKPVIGMSLRFDRIDNFWFVLRHELEHVLRGHGRSENAIMMDSELDGEKAGTGNDIVEEERMANLAAAEFCVPQKALSDFIARKSPFYADRDIVGFSAIYNLHPGLVAGQLRRRLKRYDLLQVHMAKIRSAIAPNALVDGWGNVVPVGE
jgi:HTH-type transcriptional regulator / antitoxin HigA